jgi:hypothetical protein
MGVDRAGSRDPPRAHRFRGHHSMVARIGRARRALPDG